MRRHHLPCLLVLAALCACGEDDSAPLVVPAEPGCDPLVPAVCAFPYPSRFWLSEDAGSPTGQRVALSPEMLPRNVGPREAFADFYNEADGFSLATTWLTLFPGAFIDSGSLPSVLELDVNPGPEASVQVFDLATQRRLPVWAELDVRGATPEQQAFMVHVMDRPSWGGRVLVAITDGVRNVDGTTPAAPAPFAALRDGRKTDNADIEARRAPFEAHFDFLAAQGVVRDRLLLIFESTMMSKQYGHRALAPVVEAAAAAIEASPASYTVTRCLSDDAGERAAHGCLDAEPESELPMHPASWRRIHGEVTLPGFLDQMGRIRFDDDGAPIRQEDFTAELVVNIPDSLKDASSGTARGVNFGHGFLSEPSRYISGDSDADGQLALAERMGAVFFGTRWSGLSSTEQVSAGALAADLFNGFRFHDMLVQGIANQILMVPFVRDTLAGDPLLQARDGGGGLIDPAAFFYTGISLGGIFGTTYMAVSPYVKSAVLHVPSTGFASLIPHSPEFTPLQLLLDTVVRDPVEQQLAFALTQRFLDAGEPMNYVELLDAEAPTPLGPKNMLWQCAVGDMLAPWYGCDRLMRIAGVPQIAPAVHEVPGLASIEADTAPGTSALHYYDPQLGVPGLRTDTIEGSGAHKALRRNPEIHAQIDDYFDPDAPGRIVNHCGGPCVIEPVPEPE